jgi:methionine synthase I (cobalamin-dependent)/5,10-methylenetetrahydrofolate reductase
MNRENFLRFLQKEHVVFLDGAMGTYLYEQGIQMDACFELMSLDRPDVIRKVHQEYLSAGAEVLMTNTYGAGALKLRRFGREAQLEEINRAGVRLAREAAGRQAFVAGSVGPLGVLLEPLGELAVAEAEELFRRQIAVLAEAGVDLLILETFGNPAEASAAVAAARQVTDLPLLLSFAVNDQGLTRLQVPFERCVREVPLADVDGIGINCMIGPYAMLTLVERYRTLADRPFLVMPNAGRPRQMDGRTYYVSTPDDFRRAGPRLVDLGVTLVGGCCGTRPDHIRALADSVREHRARRKGMAAVQSRQAPHPAEVETAVPTRRADRPAPSRLATALREKRFVCLAELVPEKGAGCNKALARARALAEMGLDGINIPDGPRATARMSPLALSVLVQQEVGTEAILHYACRDRNILGIQADLLGAWALGLRNLLIITGDPPVVGDLPRATGVFDLDAIGLVNLVRGLNEGRDVGGNPLEEATNYFIGVGVNPFARPLDRELGRLRWKALAGADYAITQPVFDVDLFLEFLPRAAEFQLPVLAGVWPLISLRNAEFLRSEIPGIHLPEWIVERLAGYEAPADQQKAGLEITREIVTRLRAIPELGGIQFSVPLGRYGVLRTLLPEEH